MGRRSPAFGEAQHEWWFLRRVDSIELDLWVPEETAEAVAFLLWRHGSGGAVIDEAPAPDGSVRVRAYFPADAEGKERMAAVREGLHDFPAHFGFAVPRDGVWWREERRTVREEDWAEAWKAYWKPARFGRRLVVAPSWERYESGPDEAVVRLDPGMAFGTGTHASTALCLETLDALPRPGPTVLDVGTGSGILAIAAALLGVERVTAIDVDPVAVRVAEENVRANGVADRVVARQGEAAGEPSAAYDLVLANIVADVLAVIAPDLARVLAPGGTLVLSGIVAPERERVEAAFRREGLAVSGAREREGWVALTLAGADRALAGGGKAR